MTMIVQAANDGMIFGPKGPMTPLNFIYYAAARGRANSQPRLTDQRHKGA